MNLLIVAICVNLLSVSNHYCNFKIIIEVQSGPWFTLNLHNFVKIQIINDTFFYSTYFNFRYSCKEHCTENFVYHFVLLRTWYKELLSFCVVKNMVQIILIILCCSEHGTGIFFFHFVLLRTWYRKFILCC